MKVSPFHTRAEERAPPQPEAYRECALVLPIQIPAVKDVEGLGPGSRSGEQPPVLVKGSGLKGFEPLTYRCLSDAPHGRADKSRSLYLAKLQARGRAVPTPLQEAGEPAHVDLENLEAITACGGHRDCEVVP